MTIDELTVKNFGVYEGTHTIELTPPSLQKPIILIGGMNGFGKTTLIDALQLCLFGAHAKTSNRGSMAYRTYLSKCITRRSEDREATISVSFRHRVGGQHDLYTLNRSWRIRNGSCKESFTVSRNGQFQRALAANWSSQVDEFLPTNIAHLFLFDGEQIEGYASSEESSALIGSGIRNLLGLDLVDRLQKDLQVYQRRKRIKPKDSALQVTIDVVEENLRELRSHVDQLRQDHAALLTHQIASKRKSLAKIDHKYMKIGGLLFDRRKEIEQRLAFAESILEDRATGLRNLAAGPMPLVLVQRLIESMYVRDSHEEESRRSRELADLLDTRDLEVLKHLESRSVDQAPIRVLEEYLCEDRNRRKAIGSVKTVLNLLPGVRNDVHSFIKGGCNHLMTSATEHLRVQRSAEVKLLEVREEHDNIPTSDVVEELVNARKEIRDAIAQLQVRYDKSGKEIGKVEREIESKEKLLQRLIRDDILQQERHDDYCRTLRHIDRVEATLVAYRRAVILQHVVKIEQLVLESFRQLLSKENLVTNLKIDPVSFDVTLFGRQGTSLNANWLSAGERQLLAVALLWGFAKASRRSLPTAIDTPLGRLDTNHRMKLVSRYLPFASHQVILLSTDEEIMGDYLDKIRPWVGRSYTLEYDDINQRTRIVSGYFGQKG